jgi:hypothetical protein
MLLIISVLAPITSHIAHVPGADDNPLCGISLNRLTWVQAEVKPQLYTICQDCFRVLKQNLTDDRGSPDNEKSQ